jgi:hypothetical protein
MKRATLYGDYASFGLQVIVMVCEFHFEVNFIFAMLMKPSQSFANSAESPRAARTDVICGLA